MEKESMGKVWGIAGYVKSWTLYSTKADVVTLRNFFCINNTIEALVQGGAETFVVSMDDSAGLLAALIVLLLKKRYPRIQLHCLMLWEEQAADWPEPVRAAWFHAFENCQEEIMLERHRGMDNLEKRDAYLAEHCDRLLVLEEDGTAEESRPLRARARLAGIDVQEQRLST